MPPDTLHRWAPDDVAGFLAAPDTATVVVEPESANPFRAVTITSLLPQLGQEM